MEISTQCPLKKCGQRKPYEKSLGFDFNFIPPFLKFIKNIGSFK
jgi:hypothetical protein